MMRNGFWAVVTKDGKSAWEWKDVPYDQVKGTAQFTQDLTFGPSSFKQEAPRDWNDLHGCKSHEDCNLQVFVAGVVYVKVGDETKCFGPTQEHGNTIAFLDILPASSFSMGHQTKVLEATSVVVMKFNRPSGGD